MAVSTEPAGASTRILPVIASAGTVTFIARLLRILKLAGTVKAPPVPLKYTAKASRKLVPEMMMLVPARPEVGAKEVITGGTSKLEIVV